MSMFVQVDYLKAGAGHRPERFQVDPTLLPRDPAASLARQLGPLAWLQIDGVPVKLPAVPVAAVPVVVEVAAGPVPEVAVEVPAVLVPAVVPEVEAASVAPSPPARDAIGRMIEAGGPALLSPSDAARAYADLFSSADAAKKALSRAQPPAEHLVAVTYTLAAPGQRPRRALALPEHVAGLRAWLEARLGPLASCEPVLSPTAQDASPAPAAP